MAIGIPSQAGQAGQIGFKPNVKPRDPATENINDYGNIMKGYSDVAKNNNYSPISYASSGDVTNALGNLQNFSNTGGYSESDVKNIRERGISPIRAVYANANENLKRRLAISGGYSPGYAAAVAKMARDSSQQISDTTGNVNAQLAQNIAGNKLAGSQAYGSLSSSEAGRNFDASQFNETQKNNYLNRDLSVNDAKRGLYGTTPALADMFSRNALQTNQQNEQSRQFDQSQAQRAALDLIARRNMGFRSGDQYSSGGSV